MRKVNAENCPVCGGGSFKNLLWIREVIYCCSSCKLFYRPRSKSEANNPKLMLEIYNEDNHNVNGLKVFAHEIIQFPISESTLIFDFGAGNKLLLNNLREKRKISDFQYVSLNLTPSGFLELELNNCVITANTLIEVFDLIAKHILAFNLDKIFFCAHHVFEHLDQFDSVFTQIKLSNIPTFIFLEVPAEEHFMIRTLIFKLCNKNPYFEGHVNFFSKKSLFNLANINGFMVSHFETRSISQQSRLIFDFVDFLPGSIMFNITSTLIRLPFVKKIPLTYFLVLNKS